MNGTATPVKASVALLAGLFAWLTSETTSQSRNRPVENPSAEVLISRRPAALEMADGNRVVIACRDGSLCLLKDGAITDLTTSAGASFSDLAAFSHGSDGRLLVASDFDSHEVVGFEVSERNQFVELWRTDTTAYPVSVEFDPEGSRIAVAGLWSRQISLIDVESELEQHRQPLTFAPRHLCWVSQDRLLVADAFGEMIALVDTGSGSLVYEKRLPGHRTGGLLLSADGQRVYFADQRLNSRARSTHNDVHWGLMVANQLRWLPVDDLLTAGSQTVLKFEMRDVGGPDHGKADPGRILETPDGDMVVAVGGTGELAFIDAESNLDIFVHTGARPVDLTTDGQRIFVADQLGDSVAVVDIEEQSLIAKIRLPESPTFSETVPGLASAQFDARLYQLGERMFFDSSLSHDSWISCHSCHVDGHTSGMLNDNFSDGTFHTPKRILTLLGRGDTGPFSWNGNSETLADQTRTSIESTMQSDDPADEEVVRAIAYYIKHLPAPPSPGDARRAGRTGAPDEEVPDHAAIERGGELFADLSCADCHAGTGYTSPRTVDVGLADEKGEKLFNPPSLRGLGQRDAFFHDNRVDDLRDVFARLEHQLPRKLTEQELSDLVSFLRTL